MKTEQRTIYIADDGKEFESEEMCKRHETIKYLSDLLSLHAHVDEYYTDDVAAFIVDHFERIKELLEGGV